jgi:hypothetical protein
LRDTTKGLGHFLSATGSSCALSPIFFWRARCILVRVLFKGRLPAAAIFSLSFAGCVRLSSDSAPPDATRFIEHAGLRSGPREATLADGRLFGPTLDVSAVGPEHFAGYSGRSRIDLRLESGRIEGIVANLPTSLSILSDANSLSLAGRFAGVATVLDVTPTSIRGNMGLCAYELTRKTPSKTYTGTVCGSPRGDLTLPSNLEACDTAERSVMVTVLLGTHNSVTQQFD